MNKKTSFQRFSLVLLLALGFMTARQDVNAQWQGSGTIYYNPASTTNLALGTTNANGHRLYVSGTSAVSGLFTASGGIRGGALGGAIRISTVSGFMEIGSMNTDWAHFQTDRANFYFGTGIHVNGGIGSYGTLDLSLHTNGNTRIFVRNTTGNVGIGTSDPLASLHVNGNGILLQGVSPAIFTGISSGVSDPNRYLLIHHSPQYTAASGIKAGGILVSDSYSFADPGRNDLIVKGNVGIGAADTKGYRLAIAGKLIAEDVVLKLQSSWPDFVFEPEYDLPSLNEVELFTTRNKHLPGIPSSRRVAEVGIELGEMNALLLQKIEELTLYLIELNKNVQTLNESKVELEAKIRKLETMLLEKPKSN